MFTPHYSPEVIEQAFQKFQATLSSELKMSFNGRLERGLEIAREGEVTIDGDPDQQASPRFFNIRSKPWKPSYLVDLEARSCTCPDHWKGHFCKHRIAANIIKLAFLATKVTSSALPTVALKETPPEIKATERTDVPIQPANPLPEKDSVIWGVMKLNGLMLGVEVLSLNGEQVTVRALPRIIEGKKLQPQFPFNGKRNTTTIPKQELFHVKIFR